MEKPKAAGLNDTAGLINQDVAKPLSIYEAVNSFVGMKIDF